MDNIVPISKPAESVQSKTVILPSSLEVTIREQNGNDDDTISEVATNGVTAFSTFLSDIIIGPSRYNKAQIEKWKTCDRYYLMLISRIFTFGPEMTFTHTFNDGTEVSFDQDLNEFTNPEFLIEPSKEFEYRAQKHPAGLETGVELTLKSGKIIKYDFINGQAEALSTSATKHNPKRNDEFRYRNLQLLLGEKWNTVGNFKDFSATDMRELRANVNESDYEFAPLMKLKSPSGLEEIMPVIAFEEFFFPI